MDIQHHRSSVNSMQRAHLFFLSLEYGRVDSSRYMMDCNGEVSLMDDFND